MAQKTTVLIDLFVLISGFIGYSLCSVCCNQNTLISIPTQPVLATVTRTPLIPRTLQTYGCEGTNLVISCPSNQYLLVVSAFYGSLGPVSGCTYGGSNPTGCFSNATVAVQTQCNGKSSCSVVANNNLPGFDPCPGTYKYLQVNYTCISCLRTTENTNLVLSCPVGSEIVINQAAWYGVVDPLVCYPTQCSSNVTATVASMCQNINTCVVNGTSSLFGDPCPGTVKNLVVDYRCQAGTGLQQIVACENGVLSISCSAPGASIYINDAFFGSLGNISQCTYGGSNKDTCYGNATAAVQLQCDGQSSCSVNANNNLVPGGDPCPGTYKYLQVNYKCIPCARATENNKLTIVCSSGSGIIINQAAWYGIVDPLVCFPTQCSSNVTSNVASICQNKNVCVVDATTSAFGVPCSGTTKRLAVDYQCQSVLGLQQSAACENSNLVISCSPGTSITINDAFYGSLSPISGCNFGGSTPYTCFGDATLAVTTQCEGQASCSVLANNNLLPGGDPCPGTYKYLQVNYKCVSLFTAS